MKFIAYILIIHISFLSVQTAVVNSIISCVKTSEQTKVKCDSHCCNENSDENNPVRKTSKDCCPNGTCNSFEIVDGYIGYLPEQLSYQFYAQTKSKQKIFTFESDKISGYYPDCFHPPELV